MSLEVERKPSLDFFTDSDVVDFKGMLVAKMKRLQSAGVGSKKRQAEVLAEDEELLWQKGLHPPDTCRHYEWPLFCFAKRQRAQTIEIYSLPD